MKCFAMMLDLKDDPKVIRRYKIYHKRVWPEVVRALRVVGIRKMRIFLKGRHEFMYCEVPDNFNPKRDFWRYLQHHPRCQEWDNLMRTFQEPVPEAKTGEWWSMGELVFDLDWFTKKKTKK